MDKVLPSLEDTPLNIYFKGDRAVCDVADAQFELPLDEEISKTKIQTKQRNGTFGLTKEPLQFEPSCNISPGDHLRGVLHVHLSLTEML